MTLAAALTFKLDLYNHQPVLIADALVTRGTNSLDPPPFRMPTSDHPNLSIFSTGRVASALCQKLCILTPKLAVVWSGNVIRAKSALLQLRTLFDVPEIDPEKLERTIATINDVFIAGHAIIKAPQGAETPAFVTFSTPSLCLENKYFTAHVGGSGDSDFVHYSDDLIQSLNHLHNKKIAIPISVENSGPFFLTCDLIGRQLIAGEGLENRHGGFYECAHLRNGVLEKRSPVCYLVIDAFKDANGMKTVECRTFVYVRYIDDTAVVRRIHFSKAHDDYDLRFVIRPLIEDNASPSLDEIKSMTKTVPGTNTSVSAVYVNLPNAGTRTIAVSTGNGEKPFQLIEDESGILCVFSESFKEYVGRQITD